MNGQGEPAGTSGEEPGMGGRVWAYIKKHWNVYVGAGVLAVLTPVLVASEASMKSLIDDWFNTCSVIVELGEVDKVKDTFLVRLYVQGDPPEDAFLVVSSLWKTPSKNTKAFKELSYRSDMQSINRALHPGLPLVTKDDHSLEVSLSPFKSKYMYSFLARMQQGIAGKIERGELSVGAFVKFPETSEDLCRVEDATPFNKLVGSSDWAKFFFLAVLVIVLIGVTTLLKPKAN